MNCSFEWRYLPDDHLFFKVRHIGRSICLKSCDEYDKMRIVVIGSGPTALGAIHRLYETGVLRNGLQVVVLEQSLVTGGLSISERDDNGFLWDMGGHVIFTHYDYFDTVLNKAVS